MKQSLHLLAGVLLLLLATLLVYWPGLDGGFVFDDLPNIVDNTDLHVTTLRWADWTTAMFSSPASALQRPLAMLSLAANHYFTGLDPRPMKLTNLLLHMGNALLVFGMLRCLLRAGAESGAHELQWTPREHGAVLFATGAWALNPINLMAVLFIVQRMESLSHAFVFAGLWCYFAGRRRQLAGSGGWPQVLAGLIAFTVVGLLSKESAVLLPLYAFLAEFCLLGFRTRAATEGRALKWLYVVVLLLPALSALLWFGRIALDPANFASRNFTLGQRLLTECRIVLEYLHWSVLPDLGSMGLYHDDYVVSRGLLTPPSTLLALLLLAALLALAFWLRRRRPLAALGLLWFFAAQLLTATIIPLELMFEHRNYFASVGVAVLLADLLLLAPRSPSRRRLLQLLAVVLLCAFAAGTWLRARQWDHPARFVANEVARHPLSPRATYEQGRMLVMLSGFRADSPYFEPAIAALEHARQVPGSNLLPAQALLILAARSHQPQREAWWQDVLEKLRAQPIGTQVTASLAAMVACSHERLCAFPRERMLEMFGAALSRGDNAEVCNIYGSYALNDLNDPHLTLGLWQEAVRLQPREPQYRINLAKLLISMRADEPARAQIAALRAIGRLGQYESLARKLEQRMQSRPPPATP